MGNGNDFVTICGAFWNYFGKRHTDCSSAHELEVWNPGYKMPCIKFNNSYELSSELLIGDNFFNGIDWVKIW